MTFDEFLERVRSEPDRIEEREVRVATPELLDEIRRAAFVRVDQVEADPRHTLERRTFRTGHLLGPPVDADELTRWTAAWPQHALPEDLVRLFQRANGIHLWADLDHGRSYEGLAPLSEWQLARTSMWGEAADPTDLSDRYLALSYHSDGSAFIVLNVDSAKYFLMDSCGADETCEIGDCVSDLLDWIWDHRIP